MVDFVQSRMFDHPAPGGGTVSITVTVRGIYNPPAGPGQSGDLNSFSVVIEPCNLVKDPAFDPGVKDSIVAFIGEKYGDIQGLAGLPPRPPEDLNDIGVAHFERAQECVPTPPDVGLYDPDTSVVTESVPGHADQVGQASFTDSDGSSVVLSFDPLNTQPWETRTTETDPSGRVVSDAFDYGNVVDNYIGTHALPGVVLAGLNAAEAENLVASVEREIYSGDTTNASSTASPFSFDPNLPNAVHDFRVGTLDVDVETGTVDTAPTENGTNVDLVSGANYGYDATGIDDGYDPWAYQYNGSAFATYDFDEDWG